MRRWRKDMVYTAGRYHRPAASCDRRWFMGKFIDLTDQTFDNLHVIKRAETRNGDTYWICECVCGEKIEVRADHLMAGKIRSCGCLSNEMKSMSLKTHGMTHTLLYGVWNAMIQRCENPKNDQARLYQERGIKVCNEWHIFENFKNWALRNGYNETLTIDRIDNNGNYEPSNCRWTDLVTQANNKRTNRKMK